MDYIVERIEENFVILELPDRSHRTVLLDRFLDPVTEGDVVFQDGKFYRTDVLKTVKRREEMVKKTRRLFGE